MVLNDADPTLPAFIAMDRAMRAALAAPGRRHVDIYSETLDMLRFPEAMFERELVALLDRKYQALPVDAVVAIGPASFDFAEKHRARVWPAAPILFTGVPVESLRERRLGPATTGVPRRHDIAGTAELALRLRPSTRRLIVISGSGDFDHRMALLAREQLAPHAARLKVEYWQDAPIGEFMRRLAQLGRDDAVLYLAIGRDAEGRTFVPLEVASQLSAASPAPLYGPFETYIGKGAVAGAVYSFEERGRRIGELVHEVLSTGRTPPLAVDTPDPSSCMADARELERFGMSERLLPPDCKVLFVPPSVWREYRWYALGALLIILAQAALIVALVLQRRGRVKAEGEVRHRRAELAQASRLALAGELIASIAHEINQPLGAILANAGAAEAILRRDPRASAELREILADIRKADLRASEVIKRVRALVTAHQAEREPAALDALVSEVVTLLKAEASRRGVAVETAFAPGLPPLMVDRVQVQQAVVNLCLNAMEAMADRPAGKRRLDVRTARADGGVEIAVADTGPGIHPEYLPQVFNSFFTTKTHGTGLGLAITRSIVDAHHGKLSAENRPEGGALFRIVLPA